MLNIQREGSIVNSAILIVVIAHSAVEHVIAQDHIEGLGPRIPGTF